MPCFCYGFGLCGEDCRWPFSDYSAPVHCNEIYRDPYEGEKRTNDELNGERHEVLKGGFAESPGEGEIDAGYAQGGEREGGDIYENEYILPRGTSHSPTRQHENDEAARYGAALVHFGRMHDVQKVRSIQIRFHFTTSTRLN